MCVKDYVLFSMFLNNLNTHKTCCKCCYNNKRSTGQKQQLLDGRTVENKGKLILKYIYINYTLKKIKSVAYSSQRSQTGQLDFCN